MKKFFFLCMAVVAMTACSDDSSTEGGGNNGGNNGGGQTTQASLTVSPTNVDFSTDGGTSKVTITSSAAWTAEFVNDRAEDWCSIDSTSGSAGTSTLTITATANDTPDDRTASIVVKSGTLSKTINVSQKQKDALTVTSSKFEVDAEGGEVVVEVKANIDFEYAIDDVAKDWISYEGTRAIQTSTLVFKVAKNDDTEKREGKITIKSGEFSEDVMIYQAGEEPSIVISQNEYTVSSDGETIAVEVSSNVDVTVELPTDIDWIKESTTRATSTNTYYFDITKNEDYDQRSAEIRFTNKENNLSEVITITQAQKDAIVLAKSEYEFGAEGGNLDFEIQTNVDITVTISDNAKDWIQQVETRALETMAMYFNISACSTEEVREGIITISGGNATQCITIKQSGVQEILEKEREALIAFYEALEGDNWTLNDNWCSDKPVYEWYGVFTDNLGRVKEIGLNINNLTGYLPETIGDLTQLQKLSLGMNHIYGTIPQSITQLRNLTELYLDSNNIDGEIPTNIGDLLNLQICHITGCQLSGSLPESIGELTNLRVLSFADNKISGSIPSSICNLKNLTELILSSNDLSGVIPSNIGDMEGLVDLNLSWNDITGEIPPSIGKLSNLKNLNLRKCKLSGCIPESIGELTNLQGLSLDFNMLSGSIPLSICNLKNLTGLLLSNNRLSGQIPANIGDMESLSIIDISTYSVGAEGGDLDIGYIPDESQINHISGEIPISICNLKNLHYFCADCNNLTGTIPDGFWEIPTLTHVTLTGNSLQGTISPSIKNAINLQQLWLGNNYLTGNIPDEICELVNLQELLLGNSDEMIGVKYFGDSHKNTFIGDIPKNIYKLTQLQQFGINNNNITGEFPEFFAYNPSMQNYSFVPLLFGNRMSGTISEEVLTSENWKTWCAPDIYILPQQDGYGFTLSYELYESTDYSRDGEIKQLQQATKGDGIDIVLMGDAYSDRLIADGTYDNAMRIAMEQFFAVEPYKSFRDHFNVYSVTAVSKNEVYTDISETALAGYFGAGTLVGGNDQRAFYYAKQALGEERMDEALVVVMMNSTAYAGTCYMYGPSEGDWGDGVSVSYFPIGVDTEALAQVLHHEAGGHGFSKLGDEYAYESQGTIPGSEISDAQNMSTYGWWKNVDFTNDPTQVKWYHFLTDSRYSNEGLGIYEGAFTYWTGAYRPTENSIMNTNVGGFNAPSREAIYYRIHKLAYGADWEYDYEEFVEYDAINRTTVATTRGIPYRLDIPEDFKPLYPPVVVNDSWRNAKNNAPKKATTSNGGNEGGNLRPASLNRSNLQTMSISPNMTVSSSGMVVITNPATNRRITSKPNE